MQDSIRDAMVDAVDKDLNKEFSTMPTSYPLPFKPPYDVAILNYDFLDVTVETDHISVSFTGFVTDVDSKYPRYPAKPPAMPEPSASVYGKHHLTMQLSTLAINSAMWVYSQRGLLMYEVTSKDLEKYDFLLNTDTFIPAVPGLSKWPDHNM